MQNALTSNKRLLQIHQDSLSGVFIALTIISLWLGSLVFLFSIDISKLPILLILPAVLLRVFLQTGIFITAHDAIHGLVFPKNRQINNFIGSLATTCYALLPYNQLLTKHWMHHRYPASTNDPDFYDDEHQNPFAWYFSFMKGYLQKRQAWILLIGMSIFFYSFILGLHIPIINVLLFWLLPLLLSSIQLFYFGIYLPHRRPEEGYNNRHRTNSNNYSVVWSFITCYHFGYHWEHHEYPDVPWYDLPSVRKI
jgi:beta-carotene ketolase (CrtW type)